MIIAIVSDFWGEYELYKTNDKSDIIEAIKQDETPDASKHLLIGCQDDFTAEIAQRIADDVIYISDILE